MPNEVIFIPKGTRVMTASEIKSAWVTRPAAALPADELQTPPQPAYVYLSLANNPGVMAVMRMAQRLLAGVGGIQWEPAPVLHVTLAYAPAVNDAQLYSVATSIHLPDNLFAEFAGAGIFENGDERALHIQVLRSPDLEYLQAAVVEAFGMFGTKLSPFSDPASWQPHITLGYLPAGVEIPPELTVDGGGALSDLVVISRGEYEPFAQIPATRIASRGDSMMMKARASIHKGTDGQRLMLLVTANAYKDREKEIVSQKALEGYVSASWKDNEFIGDNPLLVWHAGDPIGDIIYADTEGPFLIEVARERPNATVNLAEEGQAPVEVEVRAVWDALEQEKELGASHEFYYITSDREDGVYEMIHKTETSVLPRWAAANYFTEAEVLRSVHDGND